MSRPAAVGVALVWVSASAGADPDPLALLRGVRAAREGLSSRVVATQAVVNISPPRPDGRAELDIAFVGDRRRVVSNERALFLNEVRPGKEDRTKGLSFDEMIRQRLGGWEQMRDRTVVDAGRVLHFVDQAHSAKYSQFGRGTYGRFTDPRLFGLAVEPGIRRTVADCLGYEDAAGVTLAGSEQVAGRTVWKVAVARPGGLVRTFWVEDTEGFRVHRYEGRANTKDWTMSETAALDYGPDRDRPPLPVRMDEEHTSGSDRHIRTTTSVERADYRSPPDPDLFGLKGLDLKPGTPVENEKGRTLGYWDGQGLQKRPAQAKQAAARREAAAEADRGRRRWLWLAGGVVAVAVAAAVSWRLRRRRRAG